MVEYRYSDIQRDGRTLYGVAMPYGSLARLPFGLERFLPRAFGAVDVLDVIMNVQHNRERPIARTGGGGLTLTDSPIALMTRAELPETREADDVLRLVEKGILRGQSVEFNPVSERQSGNIREIDRAALTGIGIVDRAAYKDSSVAVRSEIRQLGRGLTGAIAYGVPSIVSDRGADRKEVYDAGAFDFALDDLSREVSLILGDYSRPMASRLAGTLEVTSTAEALTFAVADLPNTSYTRDFQELLITGAVTPGVVPFYTLPPSDVVPEAFLDLPEEGNPEVNVRHIRQAVLTAIAIQYRPPRGNPGEVQDTPVRRRWWL